MRILMFGWEFPPRINGGLGVACYGLSTRLAKRPELKLCFVMPHLPENVPGNLDFSLIAADSQAQPESPIHAANLMQVLQVDAKLQAYGRPDSDGAPAVDWAEPTKNAYEGDLFQEVSRYAAQARQLAKTQQPEVVHGHDWMTFPAALEAALAADCPLVLQVHSTELDRTGDNPDSRIFELERFCLSRADRIIAVSQRTREQLITRYELNPQRIQVVHNALFSETPEIPERKPPPPQRPARILKEKVVLFLGRVTRQKGPDYFIDAARIVLKRQQNVRFVMAGAGDMLPKMIERIARLGIQSHFHFTGFLQGADLQQMFAVSDLYVMPSVSEPFGIAPLEALLHGVPVIMSRQSGAAEILHDVIQVDFWNVEELADRITDVLSSPDLAREQAETGRRSAISHTWEHRAAAIYELYTALLDPNRVPNSDSFYPRNQKE